MKDRVTVNVFVGISMPDSNRRYAMYRFLAESAEDSISVLTPPVRIASSHTVLTAHYVRLKALRRILVQLAGSGLNLSAIQLICYLNDPDIEFEWNTEYQEDHAFSVQTRDRSLWNSIADLVRRKHIALTIGSSASVLNAVCTVEKAYV